MEINLYVKNQVLYVFLNGRLDTLTSPKLDEALGSVKEKFDKIIFDFEHVEYMSSAGLRELLIARKLVKSGSLLVLNNVKDQVKDVLMLTGFDSILTIR